MTEPLILRSFEDNSGETRRPDEATLRALKTAMGTDEFSDVNSHNRRAFLPQKRFRHSGLAIQLYALRRQGDWGIGDFSGLGKLLTWGRTVGLDYIGVSPVHALRLAAPTQCSPYYPSSRLALNPLHIDVDSLAAELEAEPVLSDVLRGQLAAAKGADLIDYERVAALKRTALFSIYQQLDRPEYSVDERLRNHALVETYDEVHGGVPSFHPASKDAADFTAENRDLIEFHVFLQWAADRQLQAAAAKGGTCSLYLDLAVGAAPDGSEVWSSPNAYVRKARLGAPPDPMAPGGQDWGLVPLHPLTLVEQKGERFAQILDASARYAGALRIDHALGLNRQYLIPEGASSGSATYVRFPQNLMLGTIAAVSNARECVMIGEDLGTVPAGLTEALHNANICSYEVARWARHDNGEFFGRSEYPRLCLATATTHDVAPIAGWLDGSDLDARLEAGHLAQQDETEEREQRSRERSALLRLWGLSDDTSEADEVVRAAHHFLASTSAGVVMMAVEDLFLQKEMMNLPGTMDEYPNWQRRYPMPLEKWTQDKAVLRRLNEGLGR